MASQIAHIIYAQRFFDQVESGEIFSKIPGEEDKSFLTQINRDEFFLGSVFPDIRFIDDNISRKKTHLLFDNLNLDFSGLTSFQAGWKFHLYCDMKREDILNSHGFYSIKKTTDLVQRPAKLLEDELVYDEYNNWEKLVYFFNNPPYIESDIDVSKETFFLWYAILAKYLEKKPDNTSMKIFMRKLRQIETEVEDIVNIVSILRKNKKACGILEKVNQEII